MTPLSGLSDIFVATKHHGLAHVVQHAGGRYYLLGAYEVAAVFGRVLRGQ